jgi:hypothetical protein
MNCRKARQNLFGYFKHELSLEETTQIKAHLDVCPDCANEVKEIEEMNLLLTGGLENFIPSANFNEKLMLKVRAISSEAKVSYRRRWWEKLLQEGFPSVKLRWALVGAVSVVMIALITTFIQKRSLTGPEYLSQNAPQMESQNIASSDNIEDSSYQKLLEELSESGSVKAKSSPVRNKTFVIDNFGFSTNRGEDGRTRLGDLNRRFIIERSSYPALGEGGRNRYVLPVVSTQPASEKIDY